MFRVCLLLIVTLCPICVPSLSTAADGSTDRWSLTLTYSPELRSEPFTGRVLLFFTAVSSPESQLPEPRFGPNWFASQPMVSLDVENWKPDTPFTFSLDTPGVRCFPDTLKDSDLTGRKVQAVVRFNPDDPVVGNGVGNAFSPVEPLEMPGDVFLPVTTLVPEEVFPEGAWSRLLKVRSSLLSEFHGKEVFLQGAVTVPAGYDSHPDKRYPVILEVPGFGGTHFYRLARRAPPAEINSLNVEFIRVMLDPRCPLGHHVFANSANNGPYGDAFVQEFLPELDRTYRTAGSQGRFLTGHSSGGWSTLWLQTTYPEEFAGTWSTAPDPVDFRDFQQVNLYRPGENLFVDSSGHNRPLARLRGVPVVDYVNFSRMEDVLGTGGQLCSFDAVFSPRGADGHPVRMWNHETGEIDSGVSQYWGTHYDIRRKLEENWPDLQPKLQGKLRVFMGLEDTFYLEGSTILLKESLEKLGSDAVVELFPGRHHGNLVDSELRARIEQEMAEKFVSDMKPSLQNED